MYQASENKYIPTELLKKIKFPEKKVLIEDINEPIDECFGMTLLHRAILFNQADVIRYLLSHGASLDKVDNKQCTPLHYTAAPALQENSVELITLILNHIDSSITETELEQPRKKQKMTNMNVIDYVNKRNVSGNSVLYLFCSNKKINNHAIRLLLQAGANPLLADYSGVSPLSLAYNLQLLADANSANIIAATQELILDLLETINASKECAYTMMSTIRASSSANYLKGMQNSNSPLTSFTIDFIKNKKFALAELSFFIWNNLTDKDFNLTGRLSLHQPAAKGCLDVVECLLEQVALEDNEAAMPSDSDNIIDNSNYVIMNKEYNNNTTENKLSSFVNKKDQCGKTAIQWLFENDYVATKFLPFWNNQQQNIPKIPIQEYSLIISRYTDILKKLLKNGAKLFEDDKLLFPFLLSSYSSLEERLLAYKKTYYPKMTSEKFVPNEITIAKQLDKIFCILMHSTLKQALSIFQVNDYKYISPIILTIESLSSYDESPSLHLVILELIDEKNFNAINYFLESIKKILNIHPKSFDQLNSEISPDLERAIKEIANIAFITKNIDLFLKSARYYPVFDINNNILRSMMIKKKMPTRMKKLNSNKLDSWYQSIFSFTHPAIAQNNLHKKMVINYFCMLLPELNKKIKLSNLIVAEIFTAIEEEAKNNDKNGLVYYFYQILAKIIVNIKVQKANPVFSLVEFLNSCIFYRYEEQFELALNGDYFHLKCALQRYVIKNNNKINTEYLPQIRSFVELIYKDWTSAQINYRMFSNAKRTKGLLYKEGLYPVFIDILLKDAVNNKINIINFINKQRGFLYGMLNSGMTLLKTPESGSHIGLMTNNFSLFNFSEKIAELELCYPQFHYFGFLKENLGITLSSQLHLLVATLNGYEEHFSLAGVRPNFIKSEMKQIKDKLNLLYKKIDDFFKSISEKKGCTWFKLDKFNTEILENLKDITDQTKNLIPRYRLAQLNSIFELLLPDQIEKILLNYDLYRGSNPVIREIPEENFLMVKRLFALFPDLVNKPDKVDRTPIFHALDANRPYTKGSTRYPYFDFLVEQNANLLHTVNSSSQQNVSSLFIDTGKSRPEITMKARQHAILTTLKKGALQGWQHNNELTQDACVNHWVNMWKFPLFISHENPEENKQRDTLHKIYIKENYPEESEQAHEKHSPQSKSV